MGLRLNLIVGAGAFTIGLLSGGVGVYKFWQVDSLERDVKDQKAAVTARDAQIADMAEQQRKASALAAVNARDADEARAQAAQTQDAADALAREFEDAKANPACDLSADDLRRLRDITINRPAAKPPAHPGAR